MTTKFARDLAEGDIVDLRPAIRWIHQYGDLSDEDYAEAVMYYFNEYAIIDEVRQERHRDTDEIIAVVYSTNGGNWAIPAEFEIEVHGKVSND